MEDFCGYLQQLAKLSDRQGDALRKSNIVQPHDLRKLKTADDLDDLLCMADPDHFISSRNRAKLDRIHAYIRQKHKFVPGKTHFSHVLDMLGDASGELDDDNDSSSVMMESVVVRETTPRQTPSRAAGFIKQLSSQSIGWGYASTSAGSELNYQPDETPAPKKSRRGGRRRPPTEQGVDVAAKYNAKGDVESCATSQVEDSSTEDDAVEGNPVSQWVYVAAGCLALSLGLGVGIGVAIVVS